MAILIVAKNNPQKLKIAAGMKSVVGLIKSLVIKSIVRMSLVMKSVG